MKTSAVIFGGILVASVAMNAYLYKQLNDSNNTTTCFRTTGFDSPTTISDAESSDYVNQYKLSLPESDPVLGAIITRTSIDEILCTKDCNAIAYTLGRDSIARTGPEGNGVFAIITGVHVDYDVASHTITRVSDLGIKRYIPRYWCPPSCLP